MYRLKKNVAAFEVVDGKYAGKKYKHGKLYAKPPTGESHKFEKVKKPEAPARGEQRAGQGGDDK